MRRYHNKHRYLYKILKIKPWPSLFIQYLNKKKVWKLLVSLANGQIFIPSSLGMYGFLKDSHNENIYTFTNIHMLWVGRE